MAVLTILMMFPLARIVGGSEKANFRLQVDDSGRIEISVGEDHYIIESAFADPGKIIGRVIFQQPTNTKNDLVEIKGDCDDYSIVRQIQIREGKINISEFLENKKPVPVGVLFENKLSTNTRFKEISLGGHPKGSNLKEWAKWLLKRGQEVSQTAENPTLFVKSVSSGLGLVAQDSVFRLQLYAHTSPFMKAITFGVRNFALNSRGQYHFEWTIYPLPEQNDYFSFINKIRRDWKTNFTLEGPFDFFDVIQNKEMLQNPQKLKAYFARKRVSILALIPWLDYDNFNHSTGHLTTREEYKALMWAAMQSIRSVDPSIRMVGCISSNMVSLPLETSQRLFSMLPKTERVPGIHESSSSVETENLQKGGRDFQDSLIKTKSGHYVFEIFYPMEDQVNKHIFPHAPPLAALATYATVNNSQFQRWRDQTHFILDEVGLDGVYVDQFSLAFNPLERFSYDRWDGTTVDIDPSSGQITQEYTDAALVGIQAQKALADSILSRGKLMVANTAVQAREIQNLPIFRFIEGGTVYDLSTLLEEGPFSPSAYLAKNHLGTPIALGERPWHFGNDGMTHYSKVIMKTAIAFLANGLTFYDFNTEIPITGPGKGEFGPLNHFFPLTPVQIGRGYLEGKERFITTVSKTFTWPQERRPIVLLFDNEGSPIHKDVPIEKTPFGWDVKIAIKDWNEIAIVE